MTLLETSPVVSNILKPSEIWIYPFALAQVILQAKGKIFGIAGPPGAGKTTIASYISACLQALSPSARPLVISLDDFYFSKKERLSRGIQWRAQPGSHDIPTTVTFLKAIHNEAIVIEVPRFDHGIDDTTSGEMVKGPITHLLMEGWFLGLQEKGYEEISNNIDYLIYINCPLSLAKRRRLNRERHIRNISNGHKGMTPRDIGRFWKKILEPGIKQWVQPIEPKANLVIYLGDKGEVLSASRKQP